MMVFTREVMRAVFYEDKPSIHTWDDLRGKNEEAGNIRKKNVMANQGQISGAELCSWWRKWRRDRCDRHG